MKVLIVNDVLGAENNGTNIATMNLVRYLESQGDEVRILCGDQNKKGVPNYFVVDNLNLGPWFNSIVRKNDVTLPKVDKKVVEASMDGVDIVHIMMPFMLGHKALKLAKKKGIPVTAGFHCQAENITSHFHLMNARFVNFEIYRRFYKSFYSKVDAIHYPTDFIRKVFEHANKVETNGYVISNGVNDNYHKSESTNPLHIKDKKQILFIGRISKEKSHKILIKAASLSKYKDEIQLIFAGTGPREKEVLKYAEECHIEKPIIKFFSRQDLVSVINSCDLYVHPSVIEIEAISCLEAISCGLVPVISDSPRSATNAFALSDKNLFRYYSPEDLANKIDYWFDHPEEKEKCSNEYLGYTEQFNQTECMIKMRKMLETYALKIK